MLLQLLRQRDPDLIALRRAIRVAVAVPIAIFILQQIPAVAETALFGVFACLALLLFGNFAGPWKKRGAAYLFTLVFGLVILAACVPISQTILPAVVLMAIVGLIVSMLAMLRGYLAAAQNVLLLAAVLALTSAESRLLAETLLAWAIGGVVATVAALILLPSYPFREINRQLAESYREFAAMLRSRWIQNDGREGPTEQAAVRKSLVALDKVRQDYEGNLQRPSGLASPDSHLGQRVRCAERIAAHESWQNRTPLDAPAEPSLISANRQLAEVSANQLDSIASLIDESPSNADPMSTQALLNSRREHLDEVNMWVASRRGKLEPAELIAHLDDCSPLRLISVHAEMAGFDSEPDVQDPILEPVARQDQPAWYERLRTQLSLDSPWLRLAIRTATALAASVAVANSLAPEHSFWIVLGTLVGLRFDASGTGRSALQALIGTAAGAIISAALILTIGDNTTIWWILLPLCLFFAAFTPSTFSLLTGQAAFTIAVIVLFSLLYPTNWTTAEVRLEDVAIGLVIGLIVSMLLWPRGISGMLDRRCVEALTTSAEHLAMTFNYLSDGRIEPETLDLNQQNARMLNSRARDSLDLAVSQRTPGETPIDRWRTALWTTQTMEISARLLRTASLLLASETQQQVSVVPTPLITPLRSEAEALRNRVHRVVGLLSYPDTNKQPDVSQPVDEGQPLLKFRKATEAWLANPDPWLGTGPDPRPALLVWMSDLTQIVVNAIDDLEQELHS